VGEAGAVRIDGSHGEGGGQVVRTALALSAVLGRPVEIANIRAGRRNPGLQAQHLTGVRALAEICRAGVRGAAPGSTELRFDPGPLQGGSYRFHVGTAGAISLVLQTILVPLAYAAGEASVGIAGGTHVPWSPPIHHVTEVLGPALAEFGLASSVELLAWGFYPRGGGEVRCRSRPAAGLRGWRAEARGSLRRAYGWSVVANLPRDIAARQRRRARQLLADRLADPAIEVLEVAAASPGTALILIVEGERARAGFSALGEKGKPAERVAEEACAPLLAFAESEAACDPHLADQLVLPAALAVGESAYSTSAVTSHLLTSAWVVNQFLPGAAAIEGELGGAGSVRVRGIGRPGAAQPRADA
jgi:RNA 3'-terminal phosphate cyclase (ATP)